MHESAHFSRYDNAPLALERRDPEAGDTPAEILEKYIDRRPERA
jgi:hypothetical protein